MKLKGNRQNGRKMFANDTSDKGLVYKVCKELTKLNTQKTKNPVKKWGKRHEQTFLQRPADG